MSDAADTIPEKDFDVHTFLPDFAKGPLDVYREKASFHWKEMALFLDGSDVLQFKHNIFRTLEKDPEFAHICPTSSLDKQREMAQRRLKRIMKYNFLTRQDGIINHMRRKEFVECLGMYDWSLAVKRLLNTELFGSTTLLAGKGESSNWAELADNLEVVGCFALT
jgi:acyl-CoA oxidase